MILGNLEVGLQFINFVIPLPATYTRHSQGNYWILAILAAADNEIFYITLAKRLMLLSFCLGNYTADNFIAEIRTLCKR